MAADNGGDPYSIGELAAENDPPTSGQRHWRQNRMVTDPFLLFRTLVVARTKRRSAGKNDNPSNDYKGYGLILIANGEVYGLHGMFCYERVNRESDF